jgi:hypothetical protein
LSSKPHSVDSAIAGVDFGKPESPVSSGDPTAALARGILDGRVPRDEVVTLAAGYLGNRLARRCKGFSRLTNGQWLEDRHYADQPAENAPPSPYSVTGRLLGLSNESQARAEHSPAPESAD